ncbi:MAG TPA: SRPBCC family protein [Gemmatimonadales bacterium]|nr:SRPBCC family protein [Gemmatimonadales bacterium]
MVSLRDTLPDRRAVRRALDRLRADDVNVGRTERWISSLAGGALLAYGLRRRGLARAAMLTVGGALLERGVTGYCRVYGGLGLTSAPEEPVSPVASVGRGEGRKFEHAVVVERPAAELYRFWRQFENLPRFMSHVVSVRRLDDTRWRWVVRGPAGSTIEWDAVIHREVPGALIAWRTVGDPDVNHAGSVHFTPLRDGRATEVRVVLSYEPPAGRLGVAVARLFGEAPEQQVREDLRRFKRLVEAPEPGPAPSAAPGPAESTAR